MILLDYTRVLMYLIRKNQNKRWWEKILCACVGEPTAKLRSEEGRRHACSAKRLKAGQIRNAGAHGTAANPRRPRFCLHSFRFATYYQISTASLCGFPIRVGHGQYSALSCQHFGRGKANFFIHKGYKCLSIGKQTSRVIILILA